VAKLAESFGHRLGIGEAARLAGLLHDLGKYNPAFQDYIAGRGNSVDHSTAGAAIACQRAAGGSKIVAEIVARRGVDRNARPAI
jgi:CRISPR-associated endonuclease/helicase Cas3